MSLRYCPRCRAEVEDAGGFCLLGHPLRLEAPIDSISALRAEVDKAFDQARVEIAETLSRVPVAAGSVPPPPPPPPQAPRHDPFAALAHDDDDESPGDKENGPDPMAEFAPAPRMDWGPERSPLRRIGR